MIDREDVIRLARKAGLLPSQSNIAYQHSMFESYIERFAALVAAATKAKENEACAIIAETPTSQLYECSVVCGGLTQIFQQRMPKDVYEIAKEIRARGEATLRGKK